MEQSVEAMSVIPGRMYEAWNRGDVAGFFADFAEDALFVELEGTIYRSRSEMIAAHEELLSTVMKDSQLVRGEVVFARMVSPGVGVARRSLGGQGPGERTGALPGGHGSPGVLGCRTEGIRHAQDVTANI
ncbi:SgcJ/EcaC family oxidoreductase [Streptomyces sp. NPDC026672]|uniref:SgcJ/EcaC family oxidoreductase n=1 Tax=unclassified Streptomyces TaxID=2593676 RepID=UPI0033E39EF6